MSAVEAMPAIAARNRFFGMFEEPALRRVRRRAYHVRSILRQLLGTGKERALVTGRLELTASAESWHLRGHLRATEDGTDVADRTFERVIPRRVP